MDEDVKFIKTEKNYADKKEKIRIEIQMDPRLPVWYCQQGGYKVGRLEFHFRYDRDSRRDRTHAAPRQRTQPALEFLRMESRCEGACHRMRLAPRPTPKIAAHLHRWKRQAMLADLPWGRSMAPPHLHIDWLPPER